MKLLLCTFDCSELNHREKATSATPQSMHQGLNTNLQLVLLLLARVFDAPRAPSPPRL